MTSVTTLLNSIYSDPKHPGSFSSLDRLLSAAREVDKSVSRSDVANFLASTDSYTLHRRVIGKFSRRRYLTPRPAHTIMLDTGYFLDYKNDNAPYILFIMDAFSRLLCAYPLKSLKSTEVLKVLRRAFDSLTYPYVKCLTDRGSEFVAKAVQKFFKSRGLHWYTVNSVKKVSPIERVIKSFKLTLYKVLTHTNDFNFTKFIPHIVERYNNSPHRGLMNRTPMDVHLLTSNRDILDLSSALNKQAAAMHKIVRRPHLPGTVVRLSAHSKFKKRSFFHQNTRELFKIRSTNTAHVPVTYNIEDFDGELLEGIFYHEELVPVLHSGLFKIKILKKWRYKARNRYLVEFLNYPTSKPLWLWEGELVKL